jgi:uncharacterized membrane protein
MMDSYSLLKSLHIFAVVLFLGNILITGWWKYQADLTRNPKIIAFAQRQVTLTDFIFTAGGAFLILVTGLANTELHGISRSLPWVHWGIILFSASGVIWVVVLIPIQIVQAKMARQAAASGEFPANYWLLARLWYVFGTLATVLPFANIYLMVFKPG